MKKRETKRLMAVFNALLRHFGPQKWWPAKSAFEVCVGAILTQNTSWENVSRAIQNIRKENALNLETLHSMPVERMAGLIRPSGYFRLKAKRLKHLLDFMVDAGPGGWRESLRANTVAQARQALLAVHGIGPETADSILLYAALRPSFVVDKYTLRFGERYGLFPAGTRYEAARSRFMGHLPKSAKLYNEYHALIVRLGATTCKTKPLCSACPLAHSCLYGKQARKNV